MPAGAMRTDSDFHAIKAISDEADFEVEGSRGSLPEGQFREGAFALHAALRPAVGKGDRAWAEQQQSWAR